MPHSRSTISLLAATFAAGVLFLSPAGGALAHSHHNGGSNNGGDLHHTISGNHHHHHHHHGNGPGGLGPVHGPGSSHNPIVYHPKHGPGSSHNPIIAPVVRDHRGTGGRDHRGQQTARPPISRLPCNNSNRSGCIRDHRTRTTMRPTAWHPPGYRPGHHHHPDPHCNSHDISGCKNVRDHRKPSPIPCYGNLC